MQQQRHYLIPNLLGIASAFAGVTTILFGHRLVGCLLLAAAIWALLFQSIDQMMRKPETEEEWDDRQW